jgi:hypothetical protein
MNLSDFSSQKLMSKNRLGERSAMTLRPSIDLATLTRRQATAALRKNLTREIIFSGLRHKNYHVRLLALRRVGIKNQFRFLSLHRILRKTQLSDFRFRILVEEEMYVGGH